MVAWKYSMCLASREAVFKESRSVIEFDGSKVNYCHLTLLYDVKATQVFVKNFSKQQVLSDGLPLMYGLSPLPFNAIDAFTRNLSDSGPAGAR
jgi:hypothetical protein